MPKEEKKQKKKKQELNPVIQDFRNLNPYKVNLEEGDIEKETDSSSIEDSDTYFRAVLGELFSKKNISSKTEYVNQKENFVGSKIDFLSDYLGLPEYHTFLEHWEFKRVSLNRGGRQEIVMGLEKRNEDIQTVQAKENLKKIFGIN